MRSQWTAARFKRTPWGAFCPVGAQIPQCSCRTWEIRAVQISTEPPTARYAAPVIRVRRRGRSGKRRQLLDDLHEAGDSDFWSVVERLAKEGRISPLASRSIVGQVTPEAIVYDAETTRGGSGGPVFNMNGEVVAVNAAIMPEFNGANLGVPIAGALPLLQREIPPSEVAPEAGALPENQIGPNP